MVYDTVNWKEIYIVMHCLVFVGEKPPLVDICIDPALGGNNGPDGFSNLCLLLRATQVFPVLDNPDVDFTLFAPDNTAFAQFQKLAGLNESDLQRPEIVAGLATTLLYHVVSEQLLSPSDILCTERIPVSFAVKGTGNGRQPKIKCLDDIVGNPNAFIVGPGNKSKFQNIPQITNPGSPLEYCNGRVYTLTNVIVSKPDLVSLKRENPELFE